MTIATSSNLSIAVGPVSVPAAVDRRQIVVSMGTNQMRLDEFNRWAGPLQNNISRVVAENLALLGASRVICFPQMLGADADFRVAIEVQRFESTPGESAMLDAVWTVRRAKDGKSELGRTTVRETVQQNSYDVLVCRGQPRGRAPVPGHHGRGASARCRPAAESPQVTKLMPPPL